MLDKIAATEYNPFVEGILPDFAQIRELDPLRVDTLFTHSQFHLLDKEGNVEGFIQILDSIFPSLVQINAFTIEEVYATCRDLGMLLAVIGKHGIDPIILNPYYIDPLLLLKTKRQMSPYLTVFDYTIGNPVGDRRRTFTKSPQEEVFITSLITGMEIMLQSTRVLSQLPESLDQTTIAEYSVALDKAATVLLPLRKLMPRVIKEIGLEMFTNAIQPYFPKLILQGRSYDAASGSQMPLLLFDLIVFLNDLKEDRYLAYKQKNIQFMPKPLQDFVVQKTGTKSLMKKVEEYINLPTVSKIQKLKLLEQMESILISVIKFRMPHEQAAIRSFNARPAGAVGSGGYGPEDLTYINGLILKELRLIQTLREEV